MAALNACQHATISSPALRSQWPQNLQQAGLPPKSLAESCKSFDTSSSSSTAAAVQQERRRREQHSD